MTTNLQIILEIQMTNPINIRKVQNDEDLKQVFAIRKQVFCREQKVSVKIEFDEFENEAIHFIVLLNEFPIGCARCRDIENATKLERIALLKEHRKNGFGKLIVEFLIDYAIKQNTDKIILHAQTYLIQFYKKLRFMTIGEEFKEDGLPHIKLIYEHNV